MGERSRTQSSRKRKQVVYLGDSEGDDYMSYKLDPKPRSRKRKSTGNHEVIDHTGDEPLSLPAKKARSDKGKDKGKDEDEEKRLRRFRPHPPTSYLEIKARALSQRLTVLSRERIGTDDVPEEKVVMAGSTGNVYTQHIKLVPSCDCPHARKGNQCKHIIYVMLRVLKAPEEVGYQLALTSSELGDIFRNAAPIPTDGDQQKTETDGKRKAVEGECPICYTDFGPGKEAIVYCKAACGNNIHKSCMQSWIAAKGVGRATCPYCRAKWESDDVGGTFSGKVDLQRARRNEDGYVNIASQLGLSGQRDYSTYHRPWVLQQGFEGHTYRRRY
ncbi:hypothetical protein BU23DRAFT_552081 [Bimuria novae-zelandiae CBS 107.79]|uniref:Uncharacterized protein n=1 Tax=Bimuria novae-zelandiae CBS 107.79 TaxID=1447943 RepID=A0A6A5VI40_9PLEO|nr:hypothetical protein BU23DRAFT_552081 [Bimuria novae-zelandiae CBS 107.79]